MEKWGPYDSPEDAIARRIGLIRAGICQPQWGITITFLRIAKANAISNMLIGILDISLLIICVNLRPSLVICGLHSLFFNRRWGQINTD
jgi:hypothetical protein